MLQRVSSDDDTAPRTPPEADPDLLLVELVEVLLGSWRLIAGCVGLALAVAGLYIVTAPRTYTAGAQILIDTRDAAGTPNLRVDTQVLDTPGLESQIVLVKSQQLLEAVAKSHGAQNDLQLISAPLGHWPLSTLRSLVLSNPRKLDEETRFALARAHLASGLDAKRIGLSYAIDLTFTGATPKIATTYANAFADAYVEDQLEMRREAIRAATKWLEDRIEDLRNQMNAAARKVQEFRARRDYRIPTKSQSGTGGGPADKEPTLEELEIRAQAFKTIYESYLQAYAQSTQRESNPSVTARVISRADAAQQSSPRTLRALLAAIVLGGLIGVGLAFLRRALPWARLGRT